MTASNSILHFALPKGRMQTGVFALLAGAGVHVRVGARGYRPTISLPDVETKLLKPQNIVEMLHVGSRDVGFAGADWVAEKGANLIELVDTGLDPVQVVAAAPEAFLVDGRLPKQRLIIASEYERLTRQWIEKERLDARIVRAYGATEAFPPEDADCIVDNTATGATLDAHRLQTVEVLMRSSTRLFAHPGAMEDPNKRARIEDLVVLINSVLEARKRVMLEVNVSESDLAALVDVLPCMREPTVSRLHGDSGYAVKSAVPRGELPSLIPLIRACGGSDIVVTALSQIVP